MFINTNKSIKVKSNDGKIFEVKTGWIGEVPEWVAEHWYFKALCKDGTVTAIVSSRPVKAAVVAPPKEQTPDAKAELETLRKRAAELKIPKSSNLGKDKLTAAIAEAEAKLQQKDDNIDPGKKEPVDDNVDPGNNEQTGGE